MDESPTCDGSRGSGVPSVCTWDWLGWRGVPSARCSTERRADVAEGSRLGEPSSARGRIGDRDFDCPSRSVWTVRRWLVFARSSKRHFRSSGRAAVGNHGPAGAEPRSDPAASDGERGDGASSVAAAARLPGHPRRHGRGPSGRRIGGSHRGSLVADRPASVVRPDACRTRGAGSLGRGAGGHRASRKRAQRSSGADRRQRNRRVLARRRPLALAHAGSCRAGVSAG
jgi:hypothetical protein